MKPASDQSIQDHLEKEARSHTLPDHSEVEPVWSNLMHSLIFVEARCLLVVILVVLVYVSQDPIACRRAQKVSTCIKTALPVLLHDSVHDIAFHDLESVQVLQIIQRVSVH